MGQTAIQKYIEDYLEKILKKYLFLRKLKEK
ncbi:hypothetical protein ACUXKF_001110 [Staphylococcus hominis]